LGGGGGLRRTGNIVLGLLGAELDETGTSAVAMEVAVVAVVDSFPCWKGLGESFSSLALGLEVGERFVGVEAVSNDALGSVGCESVATIVEASSVLVCLAGEDNSSRGVT